MSEGWLAGIDRVRYEGPETGNPLAFRWYDADRMVLGRRMADQLRIAVCYWHSFCWTGSDTFGAGTIDRLWFGDGDPMALAERKLAAAFAFFFAGLFLFAPVCVSEGGGLHGLVVLLPVVAERQSRLADGHVRADHDPGPGHGVTTSAAVGTDQCDAMMKRQLGIGVDMARPEPQPVAPRDRQRGVQGPAISAGRAGLPWVEVGGSGGNPGADLQSADAGAAGAGAAIFAWMPVVVNAAHEAKPHLAGTTLMLMAVAAGLRFLPSSPAPSP